MNPLTHLRRNIVAYVALFLALTAGAYAAGLKKNSVGAKQIKAAAVKADELADGSVTTPKIADGAVTGAKIAAGTLGEVRSAEQAQNAVNAQSAQNAVNAQNASNAQNAVNAQNAAKADNATHATTADDAATVGGQTVKSFSLVRDGGTGLSTAVEIGDLTISSECDGVSDNEVQARTATDNANIQSIATYADGVAAEEIASNEADFDSSEVVKIVPHAEDAGNLIGQIVYRSAAGNVVTVEFGVDSPNNDCAVWGTAVGS